MGSFCLAIRTSARNKKEESPQCFRFVLPLSVVCDDKPESEEIEAEHMYMLAARWSLRCFDARAPSFAAAEGCPACANASLRFASKLCDCLFIDKQGA